MINGEAIKIMMMKSKTEDIESSNIVKAVKEGLLNKIIIIDKKGDFVYFAVSGAHAYKLHSRYKINIKTNNMSKA